MSQDELAQTRFDLYTAAHKGQRRNLSNLSLAAGTLDLDDPKALEHLHQDLQVLREEMGQHAAHEEKHIHPLLAARIPDGAKALEEDHVLMHHHLDGLIDYYEKVRTGPADKSTHQAIALEFYRAFNRFISFYLAHIDREEESVQSTLWAHYSYEELAAVFGRILADQRPSELMHNLELMLPAMGPEERSRLLGMARAKMPPAVFGNVTELAHNVLSTKDWEDLRSRLGL